MNHKNTLRIGKPSDRFLESLEKELENTGVNLCDINQRANCAKTF